MDLITSRANPTLRLVRSLYARRSARRRERLFVAEGFRTISTLLDHGCRITHLLIDADRVGDVPIALQHTARDQDARILEVRHDLFIELSDVQAPQPVIGIFEIPESKVPATARVAVALDGVQDPGNLGSILRTCQAAGVDAVLLMKGAVDPYSPKVVRATAGQFMSLPILELKDPSELAEVVPALAGRIVIADSNRGLSYFDLDWSSPFVLVLGSEGSGPGDDWKELATDFVRIPMSPEVESLNVGAAAAVLLFEARRKFKLG